MNTNETKTTQKELDDIRHGIVCKCLAYGKETVLIEISSLVLDKLLHDAELAIKLKRTINNVHGILDNDESSIIRNEKEGYPDGRPDRELSLEERVKALCKYAADWKRWYKGELRRRGDSYLEYSLTTPTDKDAKKNELTPLETVTEAVDIDLSTLNKFLGGYPKGDSARFDVDVKAYIKHVDDWKYWFESEFNKRKKKDKFDGVAPADLARSICSIQKDTAVGTDKSMTPETDALNAALRPFFVDNRMAETFDSMMGNFAKMEIDLANATRVRKLYCEKLNEYKKELFKLKEAIRNIQL